MSNGNGHAPAIRQTPGEMRLEKALKEQNELHLRMAARINFLEGIAEKIVDAGGNIDAAAKDVF